MFQAGFGTNGWSYYTQDYNEFGIATCVFIIQPNTAIADEIMIRLSFAIFDFDPSDSVTIYEVLSVDCL